MASNRRPRNWTPQQEARRAKVAQLWKARMSVRQIAEAVGVSKSQVQRDTECILERWREEQQTCVETQLRRDLATLDDVITALTNPVRSGDLQAIDRFVKLLERRAKMLGYDGAVKINLSGTVDVESAPPSPEKWAKQNADAIRAALAGRWPADGGASGQPLDTAHADPETDGLPATAG